VTSRQFSTSTARVGSLPPAVFHATSGGAVWLRVLRPAPADTLDSIPVRILLRAEDAVTRVEASAGAAAYPLAREAERADGMVWAGIVPVAAPEGDVRLVVTATDARGRHGAGVVPVYHDTPPELRLAWPDPGIPFEGVGVLAGRVPLRLSCSDDGPGGCRVVQVFIGTTSIAAGRSAIDTVLSAPGVPGDSVRLLFVGTGAHGLVATRLSNPFRVIHDPAWSTVAIAPGPILAATPARLLYERRQADKVLLWDPVGQRNLRSFAAGPYTAGAITADGAVFTSGAGVVQWGGGEVRVPNGSDLQGRGQWVLWRDGTTLNRENVLTRAVERIDLSPDIPRHPVLAPNGTVRYALDNIWVWQPGHAPSRTTASGVGITRMVADDLGVTYSRWRSDRGQRYDGLWQHREGLEYQVVYRYDYFTEFAAENGWTAFQLPYYDAQIGTRGPELEPVRYSVAALPAGCRLAALGPEGQVVCAGRGYGTRISSPPYTAATEFPLAVSDRFFWYGGKLYAIEGNTLLRYDP